MTVEAVPEPPDAEPARPWPVRAARWAPAVSGLLLVLLPIVGLLVPLLTLADARDAPDPCGLAPADLLQRLVPTPGGTQRSTHGAGHTECTLTTERQQATDPFGSLWLDVERQGRAALQSPADRAQDLYAGLKRTRIADGGPAQYRIADVSGLGDDAYVLTEPPGDGRIRGFAMVVVLVGDTTLTVTYTAAPSSDALATTAAVAVARAVLGGLR